MVYVPYNKTHYVNLNQLLLQEGYAEAKDYRNEFDPSWKFNLFTDAMRFSLAHKYDPSFSLSVTRIDVLPHQIEAVYKIIDSYDQRFLLADDTGLGKTIMAGIIIKELEARSRADRVLIVTPAPLQDQWKREKQ